MTEIFYFSGSGHCLAVAEKFSELTGAKIFEIGFETKAPEETKTAAVVFPVYCQNIPGPVKKFLEKLKAENVALVATYGKISYGNVIYEAKKLLCGKVIAGAYIPMGHSFLDWDCSFDEDFLIPIAERIKNPKEAEIPECKKDILADIFPKLRSRIGVKMIRDKNCINCGLCEEKCPVQAIKNGKITSECIRCLRCVKNCPEKAIRFKNRRILKIYLSFYHTDEYILYL